MEGIDILVPDGSGGFKARGPVASRLLQSGFNVNALRTNDILRKEEWLLFDTRVVEIARERLAAVADLMTAGLTFNLPNAMGTMQLQWERISDMDPAIKSMDGVTRSRDDRVEFEQLSVPIYITHKDFNINVRALEASRKLGTALDVTQVEVATRLVTESLEDDLFNGAGINVAGLTAPGYTNFNQRNTYEFVTGEAWDAAGKTGTEILTDLINMIELAHTDRMFGPYNLYVPTTYWTKFQEDFKTNSDRTILERLQAVAGINSIRPADRLTANNVVLVQMTRDVVDEITGLQPTMVQWDSHGGFQVNFKVLAIMVPRVKADFDGRCGIVHGSNNSGGG